MFHILDRHYCSRWWIYRQKRIYESHGLPLFTEKNLLVDCFLLVLVLSSCIEHFRSNQFCYTVVPYPWIKRLGVCFDNPLCFFVVPSSSILLLRGMLGYFFFFLRGAFLSYFAPEGHAWIFLYLSSWCLPIVFCSWGACLDNPLCFFVVPSSCIYHPWVCFPVKKLLTVQQRYQIKWVMWHIFLFLNSSRATKVLKSLCFVARFSLTQLLPVQQRYCNL